MPRLEPDRFERIEKRLNSLENQVKSLNAAFHMLQDASICPILPDWKIREYAKKRGMITPFVDHLVSERNGKRVISYGVTSYGYDFRISPEDFRIFRHLPGQVIDPKNFDERFLEKSSLQEDESGKFFIVPGNSYALGVTIERIVIPSNVILIFIGKSTMARSGQICNTTPGEPAWEGNITLEFSNASPADARLYVDEGGCQGIFFQSQQCETTYADRKGKYQNQGSHVTLPKV